MKENEGADGLPRPAERRATRRQRIDCPVTLHGGRLAVAGRAVNLSRQGVAVDVADVPPMEGVDARDPLARVRGLQQAFVGGVVVQFRVAQEIRIPAKLVRFGTGTGEQGTPILGLRLARALADDEWARLAIRPPQPAPTRLRPVRRQAPFDVSILDPAHGLLAKCAVAAGAPGLLDLAFTGPRTDPAVLRERLGTAPRPARIDAGPEILWIGTVVVREFHGGTNPPTARVEVTPTLPSNVLARLEPPPRGA
ncbi:MAG: hypothetical protein U1E39_00940 [Planctomycetota bacterium]